MNPEMSALLEAFEALPATEKRCLYGGSASPLSALDSGPLSDHEIGAASGVLFESLDEEDASTRTPVRSGYSTSVPLARPGRR